MKNLFHFSSLFYFSILLVLPLSSAFAQDCDVLIYEFAGGGEGSFQIDLTTDGGYILAGATEQFGAVGSDIQVIKVDEFGNEIWSNIYGGDLDDIATKVTAIDDGYLVLGYSGEPYGGPGTAYLFKVDFNGNLLWENNYAGFGSNDYVRAFNMIIDNDGNIVIAGQRSFPGWQTGDESEVIVYKTDINGGLISQNNFNFWINEWDENWIQPGVGNARASSILQTSDGNYLFTGLTSPRAGIFPVSGRTIVFKTDSSLNTLWSQDYYTCDDCHCQAEGIKTVEDNQGDLYLAIKSAPNGCYDGPPGSLEVLKLNADGEYLWDVNPVHGKSHDMLMASDGNLVIASHQGLIKLDTEGNPIWEKEFDFYYRTQGGNCLKEMPNGGFAVSGYRGYQGVEVFIGITDSLGNSCTNLIEGNVYFDENDNCELDSNEAKFPQFLVELNPGPLFDMTDENGYYSFITDTGDYEITLHPINDLWNISCPPSQTHNVSFTEYYQTSDSTNFGMIASENCPLIEIDMAWNNARICNEGKILIDYCNFGSEAEDDFQVNLDLPAEVDFLDANYPWTQNGSIFTFDIGTVEVGECGTLIIQDSINCSAVLGETVCLFAESLPSNSCGGVDPVSTETLCRILTNSYDPNDKIGFVNDRETCFDSSLDVDRIHYTIRFQNTGNDTAYRVMVVDTLSENFDIRSIDLGSASHPYRFEILNSNILIWIFENINLPDSTTNNLESQGFFQFSIQSTLIPDQLVQNHAAIYFDANPPIITPVSEISSCFVNTITLEAIVIDNPCWAMCAGAIDLIVEGAVGPVTYNWSQLGVMTEDVSNLCAGSYTVEVIDSLSTTATATFIINEPSPLEMNFVVSPTTCGEANGTIDVSVFGGTSPYSYSWTAPSGPGCPPIPNQTGLPPGVFEVVITDANGCSLISAITLGQIEPMSASFVEMPPNCGACNGAIDLTIIGGLEPYSYLWSNSETGEDLSNLCSGDYEVTVTDENACTIVLTAPEIIEILEPELSFSISDPICADECNGVVSIVMENGTAPYTYDWSEDSMDGESEFENLCAGFYELTVVDDLGCTISTNFQLNLPDSMLVNTIAQASCFGTCNGFIDVTISGGAPPYEYGLLENLCPGTYQITVTDANGCINVSDAIVEELEASAISLDSIGNTEAGLSNGFVQITNAGNASPYIYDWILDGVSISADQNPVGLTDGEYFLLLTDGNGCVEKIGPFVVSSIVGTYNFEKEFGLALYPNPSSGVFKIQFDTDYEKEVEYMVFDIVGNKVLSGICNTLSGQTITMNEHSSGVYFLKLNIMERSVSKKITIVK